MFIATFNKAILFTRTTQASTGIRLSCRSVSVCPSLCPSVNWNG